MLIDRRAITVLKKLKSNNIEAYIVGGAVRDYLLRRRPSDYDICYNAEINELYRIFKGFKIYETGIKYGTVTLNYKGLLIELTRFRTEECYVDGRHPKSVNFVGNIKEDLLRRDFTINALALDYKGNVLDLFGGKNDLKNGIIKAVGNPHERFKEDALRIMRAYRFAARFDFLIEEKTAAAILKENQGLKTLSKERITEELKQILAGEYFYKIFDELLLSLSPIIDSDKLNTETNKTMLKKASKELIFPLFIVLFNCKNTLRLSNKERKIITVLKEFDSKKSINVPKLFLNYEQYEIALVLEFLNLKNLLSKEDKEQYDTIIKKGLHKKAKALKIDGNDLMALGFTATKISEIKQLLMLLILEEKIKNKKSDLIKYIKENCK